MLPKLDELTLIEWEKMDPLDLPQAMQVEHPRPSLLYQYDGQFEKPPPPDLL